MPSRQSAWSWATRCGLLLLALFAAGAPARADDVLIGAAIPFSGANATYGDDVKLGLDLGLADINAHGGLLGRPMRIAYEDSQSDRAKAAALFRKFADTPEVVAIFSYSTDEFVAVDPLATSLQVPDISLGSAGAVAKIGPYSFRVMTIVDKVMDNVLKQLQTLKHVKTLAVIYEASNNYTVTELAAVQRAAKPLGIDVVAVESFTRGDQNFTLQLTRIQQAAPDLLVVSAATNEAVPIIVQARSMGINATIFGGTSMNDPRIGQLAGPPAIGIITYFPFDARDSRPIVREFLAQLKAKNGETAPSGHTATAYDAVHLLADAIRRAGSTDRAAIRNALGATKGFEGVNGPYSYDGSGDNLTQNPHLFAWTANGYQRIEQ
jgi:branched-chain amino acid transport system substrate-binding protein